MDTVISNCIAKTEELILLLECGVCYEEYSLKNKKPYVLNCGHSICYDCLKLLVNDPNIKSCPFDKKELIYDLKDYPVNFAYMEMIQNIQKMSKDINGNTVGFIKTLKLDDGVYEGEVIRRNIRKGKGRMRYKNGDEYEGEWKNNQRHGRGKLTSAQDNSVYEGEWYNNYQNGQGRITYSLSSPGKIGSYNGEWKDGKWFGVGTVVDKEGYGMEMVYCNNEPFDIDIFKKSTKESTTIGKYILPSDIGLSDEDFQDRIIDGYEINSKGYISKGIFIHSFPYTITSALIKHGKFIISSNEGDHMILNYVNGESEKEGEISYSNGDFYLGGIIDFMKNGNGHILYAESKDSYNGHFVNDLRDGYGSYRYENGGSYIGDFMKGLRHGNGTYTNANYSYQGQWELHQKSGLGIEKYENGDTYNGHFINDKKEGHGIYTRVNGDKYTGSWENDQMHGEGIFEKANNGATKKGIWTHGVYDSKIPTHNNEESCLIF